MHGDLLCLPSWHQGKRRKFSWKSHGILLSDFGGNTVCSNALFMSESELPHLDALLMNSRGRHT